MKCLECLDVLLRIIYPSSESARGKELAKIADTIDESLPESSIQLQQYQSFSSRLRIEAKRQAGTGCPWDGMDLHSALTTQSINILNALWRFNRSQTLAWTVDIDEFCLEVWGDEEQSPSKVRAAMSRLNGGLATKGIPFVVSVHYSESGNLFRCEYQS